jgi:hypothetical protein
MTKKNEVLKETKIEEVKEVNPVEENDYEEITLEERISNIEKRTNASFALNIVI